MSEETPLPGSENATQGLILAAGRGSRLLEATENRPKCLVLLSGKSLLEWQLKAFQENGIDQPKIAVVAGYQAEKLLSQNFGGKFTNPHWQKTNMVSSLLCAKEWLSKKPTIVSYSDLVYESKIIRILNEAPQGDDLLITYDQRWQDLWSKRFADPLSDAETFLTDDEQFVIDIGRKPSTINEVNGQYMGLLKFTPKVWEKIQNYLLSMGQAAVDRLDMTALLSQLSNKSNVRIRGVPISGGWYEVDSQSDLELYEKEILSGTSWLNQVR